MKDSIIKIIPKEINLAKWQARKTFSERHLDELADSIRELGLLQPIVLLAVKPHDHNRPTTYYLVAGERRFRAWVKLKGDTAPISSYITKEISEQEFSERGLQLSMYLSGLTENVTRENLNFIDIANSILKLSDEYGMAYQEVANSLFGDLYHGSSAKNIIQQNKKVAKMSQEAKDLITNYMVSCDEQSYNDEEIKSKYVFTRSHALQVARTNKSDIQLLAIEFAIDNKASIKTLSVFMDKQTDNRSNKPISNKNWQEKEAELSAHFTDFGLKEPVKVKIAEDEDGEISGNVTFKFSNQIELDKIMNVNMDTKNEEVTEQGQESTY